MFHTLEGTHLLVWVRVDTPPGVDCNGHTSRVGWRGHTFWCGLEGGTFWCGLEGVHPLVWTSVDIPLGGNGAVL